MIDWNAIKTEYIVTGDKMNVISQRNGINVGRVYKRAEAEGWKKQREEYNAGVYGGAIDRISGKEVDRLSRLMEATGKTVDAALAALDDDRQFNRYIVTEDKETKEKTFNKMDTRALKDFTGALKDLTGLTRDFYDLPTPARADARAAAQGRLALARERLAPADAVLTVRFEDTEGAES